MTQRVEPINLSWQSPIVMLYEVSTWLCRVITTHWQETAMVAGVACAVVGAAVSFFQGMPLLACTFLFFGAVNAAGLYFMQQINAIRELEREILGGMREENEKLKTSNVALEKTTGELEKTKDGLETVVTQLKSENATQKDAFEQNNHLLSEQIKELTAIVAGLSGFGELIANEVEKTGENNKTANGILSKIKPHVENAQFVLDQFKTQFQTQDQEFSQRIQELKEFFGNANVRKCVRTLRITTKELAATSSEIRNTHEAYIKLLEKSKDQGIAYARETALLEVVRKNYESLEKLLQEDERGINKGVEQLNGTVTSLKNLLAVSNR